jgi:integrase
LLHFLRRWKPADAGRTKYVVHYDGAQIKRDVQTARAGLPWLHPHILRHTIATWAVQRNISPWEVADFLGMTVKVLEATYGHHSPDYQRRVADI